MPAKPDLLFYLVCDESATSIVHFSSGARSFGNWEKMFMKGRGCWGDFFLSVPMTPAALICDCKVFAV
jgi:hypothetical protein